MCAVCANVRTADDDTLSALTYCPLLRRYHEHNDKEQEGRANWQKLPTPTWLSQILSIKPWRVNSTCVHLCSFLCSFVSTWLFQQYRFLPGSRSTSERQKCVFPPGRVTSPGMTPIPQPVKEIIAFMKPAASTPWSQEPSWARLTCPASILFLDDPLQYCPTACVYVFKVLVLLQASPPKSCTHFCSTTFPPVLVYLICLFVSANSTEWEKHNPWNFQCSGMWYRIYWWFVT